MAAKADIEKKTSKHPAPNQDDHGRLLKNLKTLRDARAIVDTR
jgi:hypothetical protein